MKATFNYTGRQKINQKQGHVAFELEPDDDGAWRLTVQLDLAHLRHAPEPNDQIRIELYGTYDSVVIDAGTVEDPRLPTRRLLDRVPQEGQLYGRVKVVRRVDGSGLIVAIAERVRIVTADSTTDSLLPIQPKNIQPEVWRLEFDPDPVLLYDDSIRQAGLAHHVGDQLFKALVFPEAVRQILRELRRRGEEQSVDLDDPEDVWTGWHGWAERMAGRDAPEFVDEDSWRDFIAAAVEAFARDAKSLSCFVQVTDALEDPS